MTSAAVGKSTLPSNDRGINGREYVLRLVSVGFIAALVIAGVTGILGVRTASAIGSGSGYQIQVTHAVITRPGLATPFHVTVGTLDGSPLPARVTVRIDANYLEMFDENGLDPKPSASYQADSWTWWTFEIPSGRDHLEVSFDARLEPGVQWAREGSVAIVDGDDELAVAHLHTWVIP